jgi:tartrate dehydrogenase/decarboxylase/D-malate dehydrogenase
MLRTGRAMPADGADVLRDCDGVLFGAVGRPDLPDDELIWGLIIGLRQALDLAVNVRPVRSWQGVTTAVRTEEPIDFVVVRENTEGEYTGVGGRALGNDLGIEVAVHSRPAIERTARYAFDLARQRRGRVCLVTKSNAMRYGYPLWDEVAESVRPDYPDVEFERVLVDAMAARMVQRPGGLDVLLCGNLFGDILSDLAAGLIGGMGLAPSANVLPGHGPGLFEPVHGSAPDIAGKGIANPVACLLSAALLLDHTGVDGAGDRIRSAVDTTLRDRATHTPDLGGTATTTDLSTAVLTRIEDSTASPAEHLVCLPTSRR